MKKPGKPTRPTPESYEGTPAKLLPAIVRRLRRKEPALDEVTKRLTRKPR